MDTVDQLRKFAKTKYRKIQAVLVLCGIILSVFQHYSPSNFTLIFAIGFIMLGGVYEIVIAYVEGLDEDELIELLTK